MFALFSNQIGDGHTVGLSVVANMCLPISVPPAFIDRSRLKELLPATAPFHRTSYICIHSSVTKYTYTTDINNDMHFAADIRMVKPSSNNGNYNTLVRHIKHCYCIKLNSKHVFSKDCQYLVKIRSGS